MDFSVQVVGDGENNEDDEYFSVFISDVIGATYDSASSTPLVTILNDDGPTVMTVGDAYAWGRRMARSLGHPSTSPASLASLLASDWTTVEGTAGDADFVPGERPR